MTHADAGTIDAGENPERARRCRSSAKGVRMEYATAYGEDEVLKAINGPMDDVVAAQKMIPSDSQTWTEREFSILRKELIAVIKKVEQDQGLVAEILDYARETAREIEVGAVKASPAVAQLGFALHGRILAHVDLVIEDPNRRAIFMTKLSPVIQSYVAHKFGNKSI